MLAVYNGYLVTLITYNQCGMLTRANYMKQTNSEIHQVLIMKPIPETFWCNIYQLNLSSNKNICNIKIKKFFEATCKISSKIAIL